MELFNTTVGVNMVHVPYKGSRPSMIGLMSGEVQVIFASCPSALPQIKAGKVKVLGVSTLKRNSALPNVPTLDEAGLPGYDASLWYGLFAPAGTSKNIVGILSKEIVKIMGVPEIKERFERDGYDPVGSNPEEFSKFVREEIPKWAKVVKMVGIKPE